MALRNTTFGHETGRNERRVMVDYNYHDPLTYLDEPSITDKSKYLDYMQGSGYQTSPIFQQGAERWDPQGIESMLAETKFKGPMGQALSAQAMVEGETGLYVDDIEKILAETEEKTRSLYAGMSPEVIDQQVDKARTEALTDWQTQMGHESTHLGFDYNKTLGLPLHKIKAEAYGGINPWGEENWNYMHDLMYGGGNLDFQKNKLINRGLYSLPSGGWTPETYNKIRNSGLVDWQKGMLMQGPTTAAGQIALKQKSDEVKAQGQAYMDPDRGNVQAPTMTQQQMVQEAQQTGGTVNPHEVTQAAYSPPKGPNLVNRPQQKQQPKQTKRQQRSRSRASQRLSRFARRAQGGIVSINDMIGSL